MEYYSIGNFAKKVGKSISTLRVWDEKDILKPHHVTQGGHRMYSEEQVFQVLNLNPTIQKEKKVIGYCRVSTSKQKNDLERQIDSVKQYMIAKGYSFEVISDIGSGINYKNKGLNQLLDRIMMGEVERIVVLYKDRLVRLGFELIENMCKKHNVTIEIIDQTPKISDQELVEDLIQIVTVFSCRLQGKRANKVKKLLKEVSELEDS